jgi:hypothetical protein
MRPHRQQGQKSRPDRRDPSRAQAERSQCAGCGRMPSAPWPRAEHPAERDAYACGRRGHSPRPVDGRSRVSPNRRERFHSTECELMSGTFMYGGRWEPRWEPTVTVTRPCWATASLDRPSWSPCRAEVSNAWRPGGVDLGAGGRGFESRHPDSYFSNISALPREPILVRGFPAIVSTQ